MKVKILSACYGHKIVGAIVTASVDDLGDTRVSGRVLHEIDPSFEDDDFQYFFAYGETEVQDES